MGSKVRYYDWNTVGNDYVVGDIHGCYEDLFKLLEYINFDFKKDRLFAVGDLIDRGPKSYECLQLVYESWFYSVLANHEDMMFRSIVDNNDNMHDSWLYNGGQWFHTLDNPKEFELICKDIRYGFFPHIIVIGNGTDKRVNIVHAELYNNDNHELVTDVDIDHWNFLDYQEDIMLWGRHIAEHRALFKNIVNDKLSITYCGHTPMQQPTQVMTHRFIDTGGVFGHTKMAEWAKLTICNLKTDEIYQLTTKTGELSSTKW